jgi:hypothetical protein
VVWFFSGLLFFVVDEGLSSYPFHVDQLAIRVLLLIYPVAVFIHNLPKPWIPAFVATLFFLVLSFAEIPLTEPAEGSHGLMRVIYALARSLRRLAGFAKSTGVGRRILPAVAFYAKWASALNAASLGVLAFGLSVAVGGSSIVHRHTDIIDAFRTEPVKAHAEWTRLESEIAVNWIAEVLETDWQPSRSCAHGPAASDCDQPNQFHGFPPEWGRTIAFHRPPYPPLRADRTTFRVIPRPAPFPRIRVPRAKYPVTMKAVKRRRSLRVLHCR